MTNHFLSLLGREFELEKSRRHELAFRIFQQPCGFIAIHTLDGLNQHRTIQVGALETSGYGAVTR